MIITIIGTNAAATKEKLDEVVARFEEKHRANFNLLHFDARSGFPQFLALFETASLFSPKKLVVLKNWDSKESAAFRKELFAWFARAALRDDRDNFLVLYGSAPADKEEEKILKEKPNLFFVFEKRSGAALRQWTEKELVKRTLPSSAELIQGLAALGDEHAIMNEIEKIAAYHKGERLLGKRKEVAKADRATAQTKGADDGPFAAFDAFNDLVLGKKGAAIMTVKRQIAGGKPESMILGAFHHQLKQLIKVRRLLEVPAASAATRLKMHPYVYAKNRTIAERATPEKLKSAQRALVECDARIKSGRLDPKTALDFLMSEI